MAGEGSVAQVIVPFVIKADTVDGNREPVLAKSLGIDFFAGCKETVIERMICIVHIMYRFQRETNWRVFFRTV